MRILLLSLLCAINLWAADGGIIKDNSTSLSNITHWLQDKKRIDKFCGQGTIFTKTIRSNEGAKCKELLAAALANEVCEGYKGTFSNYNKSECKQNADNVLKDTTKNPHQKTKTQILIDKLDESLGKGLAEICKVIQYVFPKAKCTAESGVVSINEK